MGRSLCFIGDPDQGENDLFAVFSDAGLQVRRMAPTRSLVGELEADPPAAIVMGNRIDDPRSIIASLHERSSLRRILVLSQIKKPDHDSIERIFQDGADDFIFDEAGAQLRALAAVIEKTRIPEITRAPNGLVLLAEEDRSERIRLGRLLKRNGFDIHFAADLEELKKGLSELEVRTVVASANLPGGSLFQTIMEAGGEIYEAPPWVIIKTEHAEKEISELIKTSKPHPTVVFDKGQDAERLTFLMNEILTPPPPNARKSQRLLHGEPVLFQKKGTEDAFYGYSYNINLDGIFIRTLTPFANQDVVDLRFRPPFGRGEIAVSGQVRWCKYLDSSAGSSSPVGMGVQFTHWAPADKAAYHTGYGLLLQEHRLMNPMLAFQDNPSGDEI